jgi:hypothetical protein
MTEESTIVQRLEWMRDGWLRCPTGPCGWIATADMLAEAATTIRRLRDDLGLCQTCGERNCQDPRHSA